MPHHYVEVLGRASLLVPVPAQEYTAILKISGVGMETRVTPVLAITNVEDRPKTRPKTRR